MQWNGNMVVSIAVAVMAFIFALALDFYVITAAQGIIDSITDGVYYAIAYGGLVIVLVGITILAPVLVIVSNPASQ